MTVYRQPEPLFKPMAFELIDTTFAYDGRAPVLRSASLTIEPGAFVNVTGPSGAGKSTLLRLLCRLELPQAGTIRYMGRPLSETRPDELRRKVAYVQQTPTVISGSVRDNLLLPFSFAANTDLLRPDDNALQACLDEFLLAGVDLDTPALQLSVGQKQRVCLIRALLLAPETMLFDEPTSALDPESAALVTDAAFRVHERGGTVLYISHGRDLDGQGPVQSLKLADGKAVLS